MGTLTLRDAGWGAAPPAVVAGQRVSAAHGISRIRAAGVTIHGSPIVELACCVGDEPPITVNRYHGLDADQLDIVLDAISHHCHTQSITPPHLWLRSEDELTALSRATREPPVMLAHWSPKSAAPLPADASAAEVLRQLLIAEDAVVRELRQLRGRLFPDRPASFRPITSLIPSPELLQHLCALVLPLKSPHEVIFDAIASNGAALPSGPPAAEPENWIAARRPLISSENPSVALNDPAPSKQPPPAAEPDVAILTEMKEMIVAGMKAKEKPKGSVSRLIQNLAMHADWPLEKIAQETGYSDAHCRRLRNNAQRAYSQDVATTEQKALLKAYKGYDKANTRTSTFERDGEGIEATARARTRARTPSE